MPEQKIRTRGRVRAAGRSKSSSRKGRRWSAEVTQRSNALDLERSVFRKSPRGIALSLKRSADSSRRRKAAPYQSAMSMLNFYINRAGRGLSATRRAQLERAKQELSKLYGREPARKGRVATRRQRPGAGRRGRRPRRDQASR